MILWCITDQKNIWINPNIMKNIKYLVFVLLFISIIIYNNSTSFTDEMKSDYFPMEMKGKIYDISRIKGGPLYLNIHTYSKDDGISIRNSDFVLNSIKKQFYFRKLSNSNQCYIIKGDSIMYFDCYIFSKEDSVKIGKIKGWKPAITNHWLLKK